MAPRPDIDQPTQAQIDAGRKDERWPDDNRIDVIGQNGNTGEHYDETQDLPIGHTVKFRRPMPPLLQNSMSASLSVQLLKQCASVQEDRGRQYDKAPHVVGGSGAVERSFQKTATAFNAITGKNLRGSEVALLLQLLKDVRQWQNPESVHFDSLLDGVSYASLKAEEFMLERGMTVLPGNEPVVDGGADDAE